MLILTTDENCAKCFKNTGLIAEQSVAEQGFGSSVTLCNAVHAKKEITSFLTALLESRSKKKSNEIAVVIAALQNDRNDSNDSSVKMVLDYFKNAESTPKNVGLVSIESGKGLQQNGWIRQLVEEQLVSPERIILLGSRNSNSTTNHAMNYILGKKVFSFPSDLLVEADAADICDSVMEKALEWDAVLLNINLNSLEPGFTTAADEPGGLSSRELFYFVRRISLLKNLAMVELRCCCAGCEDTNTMKISARIISELARNSPKHF